jgi:outer membrane receptor protein involved in Fe transport
VPHLAETQGSATIAWEDRGRGLRLAADAQYTGSLFVQELAGVGPITEMRETPSFWVYNFRGEIPLFRGLSLYGGVDNITDEYQLWLDDPRYEYNWGPLRGRYYYGGLSYEM